MYNRNTAYIPPFWRYKRIADMKELYESYVGQLIDENLKIKQPYG